MGIRQKKDNLVHLLYNMYYKNYKMSNEFHLSKDNSKNLLVLQQNKALEHLQQTRH